MLLRCVITHTQLIDGQQRLTTLVLLLAYLRHRAAEAGDRVLQERLRGMVWLGADALDPASVGRCGHQRATCLVHSVHLGVDLHGACTCCVWGVVPGAGHPGPTLVGRWGLQRNT